MKTLVRSTDNVSLFLWNDSRTVTIDGNGITVSADSDAVSPSQKDAFKVIDLNSSNTTLHASVATPPSDWIGNKYIYNGSAWSANPAYVLSNVKCQQSGCGEKNYRRETGDFPTVCTRCNENIDGS
jgi:hypothetical protein